jgi:YidC/Oxa1 family membrane protein insertase
MKALGPKMEAIKKQFDGDPQRQNVETMKLYKEHNISPIGCAVPMLVQMPIWWALYATLQNSYELYNEPFFGWVHDLTVHDPFYVLPVLMTASMLLTQLLTPQTSPQAEQMKAMTYGMPVFFGFMMMSLPAGLVLYIFTNNLLSIGHSLWFRRRTAAARPGGAR